MQDDIVEIGAVRQPSPFTQLLLDLQSLLPTLNAELTDHYKKLIHSGWTAECNNIPGLIPLKDFFTKKGNMGIILTKLVLLKFIFNQNKNHPHPDEAELNWIDTTRNLLTHKFNDLCQVPENSFVYMGEAIETVDELTYLAQLKKGRLPQFNFSSYIALFATSFFTGLILKENLPLSERVHIHAGLAGFSLFAMVYGIATRVWDLRLTHLTPEIINLNQFIIQSLFISDGEIYPSLTIEGKANFVRNKVNSLAEKLANPEFLAKSKLFVEHGWKPEFTADHSLADLKPTLDPLRNYLTRQCVLKLIAHQSDPTWVQNMQQKFNQALRAHEEFPNNRNGLAMAESAGMIAIIMGLNKLNNAVGGSSVLLFLICCTMVHGAMQLTGFHGIAPHIANRFFPTKKQVEWKQWQELINLARTPAFAADFLIPTENARLEAGQ